MGAGEDYDLFRVLDNVELSIDTESSSSPLNTSTNTNGDFYWNNEDRIAQYMSKYSHFTALGNLKQNF